MGKNKLVLNLLQKDCTIDQLLFLEKALFKTFSVFHCSTGRNNCQLDGEKS